MAITVSTTRTRKTTRAWSTALLSVGLLAVLWAAPVHALEFEGGVRAGVSNTDNVFLRTTPASVDETVYVISPSLSLDHEANRFSTSLRYEFDWYRYDDLKRSDQFHRYDARLNGDLVRDMLSVELGGSRTQSVRDPLGAIPFANLSLNDNLIDRDEIYIVPTLRTELGRSVTINAAYRIGDTRYSDDTIQDHGSERATFEIDNYRRNQGITWAARYERNETDYDVSAPWQFQKATAEAGYWISENTRLFASGGQESAWDDPVDRSLQDGFWESGFVYKSGDRISAEFAAGERSFGSSWRGRLDLTLKRGQLSFSYAETPSTTGNEQYSRGLLASPNDPFDYLTDPGAAERFVSNSLESRLMLEFRRARIDLVVFDEERSQRLDADGLDLGEQSQRGVTATVAWKLGARTELLAGGSLITRDWPTVGEQEFKRASIGAKYRLGKQTALELAYNYSEEQPTSPSSTARDFVENLVALFLAYTF